MIYRWMALSGLILAAWGGPESARFLQPEGHTANEVPSARKSDSDLGGWDKTWDTSSASGKNGGWWN